MFKLKNNKGFTLVELIVVIALLGVVLAGSFSILSFGNTVHRMGVDEFEIQASARLTAQHISNVARYASATFTIPESSFKESNLTNGWDYIGIMDGEVVLYKYEEQGGTWDHYKTVVAPASDKVNYEIIFNKVVNDNTEKIIGFTILGFVDDQVIEYDTEGNPKGHITIISQSESLNSLQVVHKGDGSEPATAVAFRTSIRENPILEELKPIAQIALVLDVSGSMAWAMDGTKSGISESEKRITKLKNSANTLINNFDASDYPIYVSLVPFSTDANNPNPFYLVDSHTGTLTSIINNLEALGGTNTGDGIRRAYYNIINNRSNSDFVDRNISDYLIILVDGVSTYGSVISNSNNNFLTSDGNVSSTQVKGSGSTLDETYGTPYVEAIGNMVKADGKMKVHVIGFAKSTDTATETEFRTNLNFIGQKTGAEAVSSGIYYHLAGDEDELDIIFGEIQKEILNDLWYIDGPQLIK
ncbi:MAG: hypothetical protein XD91_1774 [Clostridiales bacterium 38_11]|nr:MAG: hypothetical protein XD91_1774 [Clostridiales bacterium 38_11]